MTSSTPTPLNTPPSALPLTRASITSAHTLIQPYLHRTPVLTNTTLSTLASTPQTPEALLGTPWEGRTPAKPKIRLFFKCENFQRIGAFKVRGAFHAVLRLIEREGVEKVREKGVVGMSSGNHAQALALAAKTFSLPAHIIMPTISTSSKIAGTRSQGAKLYFSGPTAQEREAVAKEVLASTNATLIPPYDHPDVILGQGTIALELENEVAELIKEKPEISIHRDPAKTHLDAAIFPCGGGGLLSGNAIALHNTPTLVFGAEPSYQGADDARRSIADGKRITSVSSLTIADGLRTVLGNYTYPVVSNPEYVKGVYAVSEQNIKDAMRLVLERMKCVVEPSAVVGLATILYNEEFRALVEREGGEEGWNIGVVFSGGNTTVEAIGELYKTV